MDTALHIIQVTALLLALPVLAVGSFLSAIILSWIIHRIFNRGDRRNG